MNDMQPGTLRVLEPDEDKHLMVSPVEGMVVRFGRNRPEVHICIGPDDTSVSRLHGTLEYRAGCWWVRALGQQPVRLGHSHVLWCGDLHPHDVDLVRVGPLHLQRRAAVVSPRSRRRSAATTRRTRCAATGSSRTSGSC